MNNNPSIKIAITIQSFLIAISLLYSTSLSANKSNRFTLEGSLFETVGNEHNGD